MGNNLDEFLSRSEWAGKVAYYYYMLYNKASRTLYPRSFFGDAFRRARRAASSAISQSGFAGFHRLIALVVVGTAVESAIRAGIELLRNQKQKNYEETIIKYLYLKLAVDEIKQGIL